MGQRLQGREEAHVDLFRAERREPALKRWFILGPDRAEQQLRAVRHAEFFLEFARVGSYRQPFGRLLRGGGNAKACIERYHPVFVGEQRVDV